MIFERSKQNNFAPPHYQGEEAPDYLFDLLRYSKAVFSREKNCKAGGSDLQFYSVSLRRNTDLRSEVLNTFSCICLRAIKAQQNDLLAQIMLDEFNLVVRKKFRLAIFSLEDVRAGSN